MTDKEREDAQRQYVKIMLAARDRQHMYNGGGRVMLMLTVILLAIAAIVFSLSVAFSASMDYCRPYANQVTQRMMSYVWNRAYSTCLNLDDEPKLPTRWEDIAHVVTSGEMDTSGLGVVPASPAIEEKPAAPDWRKACARAYRSWNAKTETVVRKRHRKRVRCPLAP